MSKAFQERFTEPELIGEGGMGRVFKVQDPRLGRAVAVKVLLEEHTEGYLAQRFRTEARITGSLEHPSIPPVYEFGETEGEAPFFALKLLEGETLASVIEKLRQSDPETHKKYTFAERVLIAIRLAETLHYAHTKGILHRDIKPENILLGSYGEVWLVDWGIAGPPSDEPEGPQSPDRLTDASTFMGTLEYAAPEQLAGIYSTATDQYSLGAVLYELFCLEPAHPGQERFEVLTAVVSSSPKKAETFKKKIQGRVPRETSVLLAKMLEKKAENRFGSLLEVVGQFKIISGGDIQAICPHTFTKKSMFRLGRILDTHNLWLMPLLMLWLLYPLYALVSQLTRYLNSV